MRKALVVLFGLAVVLVWQLWLAPFLHLSRFSLAFPVGLVASGLLCRYFSTVDGDPLVAYDYQRTGNGLIITALILGGLTLIGIASREPNPG